jgi:hypothetical protein
MLTPPSPPFRLQEDGGLAAEVAANFRRGDAQLGDFQAKQEGAVILDHEMALSADPELATAVGRDIGEAGMGSIQP